MSLIVPLIAAGLLLVFWRQILTLIAVLVVALVFLGVLTVLRAANDSSYPLVVRSEVGLTSAVGRAEPQFARRA